MLPSKKMRVFACKVPTDMRGSFDSLYKKAKDFIGIDPKSGHMFLFVNKNRARLKVLYHDGTGYVILAKRLDKGRISKFNPYYRNALIFTQ
jgi:transposase